ncbi:tetratricopeptide repeat protein [Leptolyngbya boryana CZ1]|uniref:Tetratricopeptide repeat protein n=1 Tax=Leptolyngbya boryana CZ1 TaxID=3060204 RepID=A0AA96X214_LEPBY|nr:tetratricopeptide repeat protein [Leptolyngbya boryana]WNZ44105.1 tetratricopeptide repeat protein [Leptolyngbya boryana CZ1]
MKKLSQSIALSGLVLGLVSGVLMLEHPGIAQTIAQNSTSEIDEAIAEGTRLFKEGSATSLRKAISLFERSLQLSRSAQALDKQAGSALALGRIYDLLGEKQKALEYYNQALPLWHAVENRGGGAMTLNNIGLVYSDLGEKQKALEYYNQSLPLWRAVGNRGGEAMTLTNIGLVYSDLGEKQKALEYYNQSLPLSRAVGDRSGKRRR